MAGMSLFSKSDDLPGVHAIARDCTARGRGWKKLSEGDIAVVDAPDITRAQAQRLIDARPAAVVNIAQFSTGAMPNFGPQLMADEGIMLVEGLGAEAWSTLKNGKKARLTEEGEFFHGESLIGSGDVLTAEEALSRFSESQQTLVDNMEAYFGNTTEFIRSESPLLIDGIGIPDIDSDLKDRKVVVLSPGRGHREELKRLRNFIREYNPVLIGVNAAADTLVEDGYTPDLIVGNPTTIGADALRSGALVILPADPDGYAAGLERIQDLGVGAMTFPAATESATDLALLLADYHGASLIVNVGAVFDLQHMFASADTATPSGLLTRAKVGNKLVDGHAVADLYTVRSSTSLGWMWALLGILVAMAVIVIVAGTSGDGSFTENVVDTWNSFALAVQDLVKGWFN
ncbi:putative cytokinetic ring protein SteA [Corynebacterium ciconiae]|uniref:putative cytokinetic ring protein SteA n=1 Tax=Corynebacterium ciconiae TaxID=227319 RepID=UPI0012EA461A|nr:putative cytokinetic ring protein SteA [Corynebacterium ciconiae]